MKSTLLEIAREEMAIMGAPIYTARVDRSVDTTRHQWMIGVYTNPNRRDGLLGYMPVDSSRDEIQSQAIAWMRLDSAMIRAEAQHGVASKTGSASSVLMGRAMQQVAGR